MDRIDKLLTVARASNRLTYLLVYGTTPLDNGYSFDMSLQKGGELIASSKKTFDTEDEIAVFIDEVCKRYNLTESNTEVVHFQIVPATEEDAREYNCGVI